MLSTIEAWAPQSHAFAALGDAVAVVDRRSCMLSWASPAWLQLQPALGPGTPLALLEDALRGLADARLARADTVCGHYGLGTRQEWDAQVAVLDEQLRLVRLTDRREQSRALQRQLDDREQLLSTSRVISVSEMASTLAHELNQPIGAAANLLRGLRARLVRRVADPADEELQALERAIEQVMFAARVIARIREFTHTHRPHQARLDLVALLRTSAALLDWDLQRSRVRLVLDLPAAGAAVRGDEVMLQQVVVNLMRNALDALRADPPPAPELVLRLVVHAEEAELQVRDNGCGLSEQAQARLFVPFASQKPSGMGIGLSICRSFVELHQGRLWFSRNAVRGTTFHLSLPLLAAS